MKAITFIAIATMSMWIADQAYAQQQENAQVDGFPGQQQVEGQKDGKGQRGQGRRGNRRRGSKGQGQQQGDGAQQGQRRGQRGGAQFIDGLLNRFDKDTNGSISLDEAPDRMKQRFSSLDADGNNSVSKEELTAAFAKMGQGRNGQGKGKGKGKGGKGKAGKEGAGKGKNGKGRNGQGQMFDPAKMMKQMDKNDDGVLSPDEAPDRMKKRFDRIDADSSGTITAAELKSSFEKMKKGGKNGQAGRDKSADPNATKPVKPKRPPMAEDGA
jgi:Ca2+-binding EF-hand superfamily protein